MFRRVQVRVRTGIGQEPWLGFSALGEVYVASFASCRSRSTSRGVSMSTTMN
jgi:hypothetical protein